MSSPANISNDVNFSSNNSRQITVRDLFLKMHEWYRLLLSKKLIIIVIGFLGGLLGIAYSLYKKPIYSAVTTFVLEDGDKSGGLMSQYAGLASMVGVDLSGGGGGIFQGDNILVLYKSRTMVQKTLLTPVEHHGKNQLLIDLYIDFNKLRESWENKPELKNINFNLSNGQQLNRLQDSVLGKVVETINKNNLSVAKLDKKLSIIEIEVKAEDEFFAKAFDSEIVKNVNDFYIQTRTRKALQNLNILQHQTDSVRSVLNGAIYKSVAVSDATPNLNVTRQVLRVPMQKSQINAEANKVILGELVKNLELAKLSLRKETPLIQVVDTPVLPLEKEKVGKIKGVIAGAFLCGLLSCIFIILRHIVKTDESV